MRIRVYVRARTLPKRSDERSASDTPVIRIPPWTWPVSFTNDEDGTATTVFSTVIVLVLVLVAESTRASLVLVF